MQQFAEIIVGLNQNDLTMLYLSDENIPGGKQFTKKSVKKLAEALRKNYSLKEFRLMDIQFESSKSLGVLLNELRRLPRLESLYLQGLKLGDNDAKLIAESLNFFPKLRLLNLADNNIQSAGAIVLANVLETDNKITEFSLHTNFVNDQAADAYKKVLEKNSTLCVLTLSQNQITDSGMQLLAKALENNKVLHALYLSANQISDTGGQALITAFQENHSLSSLDIYENKLSSACEKQIEELLERNRKLKQSQRIEKSHTIIGGAFELLTEITAEEKKVLSPLLEQEGIILEDKIESFTPGGYRMKVKIGKGGHGKLRLARLVKGDGRLIGVKKIKEADKIRKSKAEIVIHKELNGKINIIPLLGAIEGKSHDQDVLYLFMHLAGFGDGKDFIRITSLLENVSEKKALLQHIPSYYINVLKDSSIKQKLIIHVAKGVLIGLRSMHESSIYHLDLKPDNFVIDIRGNVFVIDFGCAQKTEDRELKDGGDIKTSYCSPERLAHLHMRKDLQMKHEVLPKLDAAKIDAWSAGLTLIELAKGDYPFDKTEDLNYMRQNWNVNYFQEKLSQIPELQDPASDSLWAVIKGLLNVDPNQRLSVMKALGMPIFQQHNFVTFEEQHHTFVALKKLDQAYQTYEKELAEERRKKPAAHREKYLEVTESTNESIEDFVIDEGVLKIMTQNLRLSDKSSSSDELKASIESKSASQFMELAPLMPAPNDNSSPITYRQTQSARFFTNTTRDSTNDLKILVVKLVELGYQISTDYDQQRQMATFHLLGAEKQDVDDSNEKLLDLQESILQIIGLRNLHSFTRQQDAITITWSSPAVSKIITEILETIESTSQTLTKSSNKLKTSSEAEEYPGLSTAIEKSLQTHELQIQREQQQIQSNYKQFIKEKEEGKKLLSISDEGGEFEEKESKSKYQL